MASTVEELDRRTTALERAHGETTETLRWVVTKLARVQAVQDEHTLRLERLESKVDGLESKMDGLESKMDGLDGRLNTVETQLEALPRAIAEIVDASEKRIMAAIAARA